MTFFFGLSLVLVSSLCLTSLSGLKRRPAYVLGLYLLSFANIVLATEVAGSIGAMNSRTFILGFHFLAAVAAAFIWNLRGRPPLLGPFAGTGLSLEPRTLLHSIRSAPGNWILGCGIGVTYLIEAGIIANVPPNTFDSMTCHLSRVGYWLQHGSLEPWPSANILQIIYPINAQTQIYWTVLLWGTDQLVGFAQWIATPASMVAIYGIARILGYGRRQALFGSLIWATLPEILLQSTSTQNDLIAAALFTSGIYFFYLGITSDQKGPLLYSGLALGLALGTKQTVFFMFPGLFLAVLFLWIWKGKSVSSPLAVWVLSTCIAFALVGCYMYALNFLRLGNPFGPSALVSQYGGETRISRFEYLSINSARYLYQACDLTGLPYVITTPLAKLKAAAGTAIFSALNVPVSSGSTTLSTVKFVLSNEVVPHEDTSWFGPLGILLLLPASLYQFGAGFLRKDPLKLGLTLMSLSLLVFVASYRGGWTPYQGRYFVLAATLCAPFLSAFARDGSGQKFLRLIAIGIALSTLAWTTGFNYLKPLIGSRTIWGADRTVRQGLSNWRIPDVLRMVDQLVPRHATLGTIMGSDDWDYPLFGEHFTRKLIPISPGSLVGDLQWIRGNNIQYVLVNTKELKSFQIPSWLYSAGRVSGWVVYYLGPSQFSRWDAQLRMNLLNFNRVLAVRIDNSLAGRVGATDIEPPEGGEERGRSYVSLGSGTSHGLKGTLMSSDSLYVQITFDVMPGPAWENKTRSIQFVFENQSGVRSELRQTGMPGILVFDELLAPGANHFRLEVLDETPPAKGMAAEKLPAMLSVHQLSVRPTRPDKEQGSVTGI